MGCWSSVGLSGKNGALDFGLRNFLGWGGGFSSAHRSGLAGPGRTDTDACSQNYFAPLGLWATPVQVNFQLQSFHCSRDPTFLLFEQQLPVGISPDTSLGFVADHRTRTERVFLDLRSCQRLKNHSRPSWRFQRVSEFARNFRETQVHMN